MSSLINGGLIVPSAPPGKVSQSSFEVWLAGLSPLRWYPCDDYTGGATAMADKGSQGVNGLYAAGAGIQGTFGLVPTRNNCFGWTAPSGSASSFAATGLPTGASPWTLGGIMYLWFRSASLGQLLGFNGVNINWGSAAFEISTPAGNVLTGSFGGLGLYFFAGTYDGTTTKVWLLGPGGNGPASVLASGSGAQTLNLSAATGFVLGGAGDMYVQDAFIIGSALTQAQLELGASTMVAIQ